MEQNGVSKPEVELWSTAYYLKLWELQNIDSFHSEEVDKCLLKHHGKVTSGKPCAKILFPLCGKDPGMKFLADKGHEVVGIEISTVACRAFFNDNNIAFKKEELADKTVVFRSIDNKIRLYACDIADYKMENEGFFDAIWDRGGLQAIMEVSDLIIYVEKMKSIFHPNLLYFACIYYTACENYEPLTGPRLQDLFGTDFIVQDFDSNLTGATDEIKDVTTVEMFLIKSGK